MSQFNILVSVYIFFNKVQLNYECVYKTIKLFINNMLILRI